MSESKDFLNGRVRLYAGDCRSIVAGLADGSIDSCVTDPPYALVSIGKRFGASNAVPAKTGKTGAYQRASAGFMGQTWDTGETAFAAEFWGEVLRVLKPGGHVVAFGGTRSYHRLACAIEDAGFEIRDQIGWLYGTGFPKSHNMSNGWGTGLKPAWEPIVLARKTLSGTVAATVLKHGTGAINIDGCRIETGGTAYGTFARGRDGEASADRRYTNEGVTNFAAMPGNRGGDARGRWPANILHDGSEEVIAAFPNAPGQQRAASDSQRTQGNIYGAISMNGTKTHEPRGDAGSAARFFYSAKADAESRLGSKHPTVKPVDLMQWLCRLVTPVGGVVLDPFAGTGTTGEAAWREGFSAVLIEREGTYCDDIARRLELAASGPMERQSSRVKAGGGASNPGPLFDEAAE